VEFLDELLSPGTEIRRKLKSMSKSEGEMQSLDTLHEKMEKGVRAQHRTLQMPDPTPLIEAWFRETSFEVGGLVKGREDVFTTAGELFDFKFYDRDLSLQEAQLDYYTGTEYSVPSMPGSPQAPISQVRANIMKYLKTHTYTAYECHFPSTVEANSSTNYACTDYRTTETGEYFGVQPQDFLGESVYADFLRVFDSMIIKRGASSDIRFTRDWIDIQTREVNIISSFCTPTLRIGTLMKISFLMEQERVQGSFTLDSVHSMGDTEDILFQVLMYTVALLVLARLAASFYRVFFRKKSFSNKIGISRFWCLVDLLLGCIIMLAVGFMIMRRVTFEGEDF